MYCIQTMIAEKGIIITFSFHYFSRQAFYLSVHAFLVLFYELFSGNEQNLFDCFFDGTIPKLHQFAFYIALVIYGIKSKRFTCYLDLKHSYMGKNYLLECLH